MDKQWGRTTTASQIAQWVAKNAPDRLTGRTAVVTGGYSGIGLRCVRALAEAGVSVIAPARDVARATSALAGMPGVVIRPMDLMDAASVGDFVEWFTSTHDRLDYLIGSAGIMAPPLRRDSRGHESQWSTNHLGHFQLACGLVGPLTASDGHPRLVLVSSRAQRLGGVHFDDPDWLTTPYVPMLAYAQSKTANALTAVEFDRRHQGDGVRAFAVHPGLIPGTNLGLSKAPVLARRVLSTVGGIGVADLARRAVRQVHGPGDLLKTPAQGAGSVLWAALMPDLDGQGGAYCEDCHVAPVIDDPASGSGVMPWAVDPDKAGRLWALSEKAV
ncbi:MAG: SDR family NAD(P)-dependent oxidoreductase [Propionibacteriaceae bacterium]|nr:SDR family NAD(P)-dependent oxidoreductase [Propionibacteriaceae bacterium]